MHTEDREFLRSDVIAHVTGRDALADEFAKQVAERKNRTASANTQQQQQQ